MLFNKKLNEKVKELENKLEVITNELKEQVKLSEFLLNNDKNDVAVTFPYSIFGYASHIRVEYIWGEKLVCISKELDYNSYKLVKVHNLKDNICIVEIESKPFTIDQKQYSRYFQLNKETKEFVEITELFSIPSSGLADTLKDLGLAISNLFNNVCNGIKKESTGKQEIKETEKPKRTQKEKSSVLKRYYDTYNLNLSVKGYKENKVLSEKEVATLLYLFDKYKYIYEIEKHIGLKNASISRYAHILKSEGYLILSRGMGRVANGCLIYNTGV